MIILAFYGIHRYKLVWLYYRNRKNATHEPALHFEKLPFVTIQLPIYNEQFVIDRLIDAGCRLDYPRDRFEIQLLDDSTDETTIRRQRHRRSATRRLGHPIVYLHRTNRHGYKAGALEEGLKAAKGELVAIFDADFVPPPDWLRSVVHHFAEPADRHGPDPLDPPQPRLQLPHPGRSHPPRRPLRPRARRPLPRRRLSSTSTAPPACGARCAIDEAGGWQHDTLTEDTDLSYRAQLKGWKFKYLQDVECPAELPIEMTAFKTQQQRWAKGLIQTSKKILPRVFRSDAPLRTKLEAWYHLTANISYPLMIVLSVLLMPAMIIRFCQGWCRCCSSTSRSSWPPR